MIKQKSKKRFEDGEIKKKNMTNLFLDQVIDFTFVVAQLVF